MKFACFFTKLLCYSPLLLLPLAEPTRAEETDIKVSNKLVSGDKMVEKIKLNPAIANRSAGDHIRFSTPNGETLTFEVSSVKDAYNNSKVISARSDDDVSLILTMDDKASFGNIRGDDINYNISYSKELGQVLVDQNNEAFPSIDLHNDGISLPGMSTETPGYLQMGLEDQVVRGLKAQSNNVVTMMILYSNEFANGFASPSARVNQLIAFTNGAFTRSGIDIELKLVHAQALSFDNDTNIDNTFLTEITDGSGSFSNVAALRDQHGADMVAILPFKEGNSSSGIAWVNGGNQRFAYSVTQLSPSCCDSVFAHEIGHNLGSGHERVSANSNQGSPCTDTTGFVSYACGHGNSSNSWGTIMSRLNSARVDHVFSNPDLDCLGEPCGIAQGQTNEADNRTAFNITGPIVAAFRASINSVSITPVYDLLLNEDDE